MKLDANARYATSHEWVREENGVMVCGITDHAQDELSDIVYVEVPEIGTVFAKGEIFGVAESTKAASDLYMPIGGEITAVNNGLDDAPELVNDDPFGEGWIIKFKPTDTSELDSLLDADAYQKGVESGEIE